MNLTTQQNSIRSNTAAEAQVKKVNIKSKDIGVANDKGLKGLKLKLQGKDFLEVKEPHQSVSNASSARPSFNYRVNFHQARESKTTQENDKQLESQITSSLGVVPVAIKDTEPS